MSGGSHDCKCPSGGMKTDYLLLVRDTCYMLASQCDAIGILEEMADVHMSRATAAA